MFQPLCTMISFPFKHVVHLMRSLYIMIGEVSNIWGSFIEYLSYAIFEIDRSNTCSSKGFCTTDRELKW